MRYVLDLSFDGTPFAGWQIQPNALAVQEVLEHALATLLGTPTAVIGAGRTDAGVHAHQMVAHFDFAGKLPAESFYKLNGLLPKEIAVKHIFAAKKVDFHARFSATRRSYTYRITLRKDPFEQQYGLWVRQTLDVSRMQKAAEKLLEYQDFASFCKAHGNNTTTLCQLSHAYWEREQDLLLFRIGANRFLRGMVRAIVGTLLEVGSGKISLEKLIHIIEAKDRSLAGPNVAAKGLSLTQVDYEEGAWEEIET